MMARLGYLFQIVSIMVVFMAALACSSGTDDAAQDSGAMTMGSGGTVAIGSGGAPAPQGSGGTTGVDPTKQTGSGGAVASGGTEETGGTEVVPECGNNIIEEGEICDGTDLASASCESLMPGFTGTLSCLDDCQNYDMSMCAEDVEDVADSGPVGDAGGYGG